MTRLQKALPEGEPPPPEGEDYFIVASRYDSWYVSTAMARALEASLDADPEPRWVVFVDLTGARVRMLARSVESVAQCTGAQRAAARSFDRRRRLEAKADRAWDDDDWP